jgi:hypothetical protein
MKELAKLTSAHRLFISELSEKWEVEIEIIEPYFIYEINRMYLHIGFLIEAIRCNLTIEELSDWYWTCWCVNENQINLKTWLKIRK